MPGQSDWPEWWQWELDSTDHLRDKMLERGFSEVDLRAMLHDARSLRRGKRPGRWIVSTRWHGQPWKVIVEPLVNEGILVVVTAYPVI